MEDRIAKQEAQFAEEIERLKKQIAEEEKKLNEKKAKNGALVTKRNQLMKEQEEINKCFLLSV